MIVRKLPYILYRDYGEFAYLTDNRNFGYDTFSHSCIKVGDLVISHVGSIFYSMLSDSPQNIDSIVHRLRELFCDVPISVIREDALEFYKLLHLQGFIFCGEPREYETIITSYFSYANTNAFKFKTQDSELCQNDYIDIWKGIPRLNRVQVDISGYCNENCIHCYIPADNKHGLMSLEIFDLVLKQCKDLNVLNLTISGGEPLLNKNLKYFLLKCKEFNFSVNILSNLTMLTDELIDIIVANPLISVQTSLYSMDEKIHDSITCCRGSYEKTIAAVLTLHERNVPLQINCPIMKQNLLNYKEVLDFAESLNIAADSDYSIFGRYDLSRSNLNCRLSISEVEMAIREELSNPRKLENLKESISNKIVASNSPICPICKNSCCVSNNGNVYPCEGLQSWILGNLKEKSLYDIWMNVPKTCKLRNLSFRDFPKCNDCSDKLFCNICLVMDVNESQNFDKIENNSFQCGVANLKHKIYDTLTAST